jgi:hypothetical protein
VVDGKGVVTVDLRYLVEHYVAHSLPPIGRATVSPFVSTLNLYRA